MWEALVPTAITAPESAYTRRMALHGDRVLPFLLEAANSSDPDRRADVLLALAQIAVSQRGPNIPRRVASKDLSNIAKMVRDGLDAAEWIVRYQAIKAVAMTGTAEDVVLLDRIAREDPESVTDGGRSGKELRYPMREHAKKAADQLRARLAHEGDRVR
jgi:hypothetical protein